MRLPAGLAMICVKLNKKKITGIQPEEEMTTNFQKIERANTIVLSTPSITLAAAICDMLEWAGISAVLSRHNGSPVVAVGSGEIEETRQLLSATWAAC
jgi:hypothetical protein